MLPPTELVGGGTWAIALPQPVRSVPWAFVYLVQDADDALHLIDSGWKSDENWDLLVSEVAALGFDISDVATLTISHLHQDHLGLGKRLREATGARLMMHRAEQESIDRLHAGDVAAPDWVAWGVPEEQGAALVKAIGMNVPEDAPADVLLEDGDTLPYAGREFRVAHTPGHTPGSICIVVADEKLIFTGDHVLPTVNSGLGLGGSHIGALADAVASYDRMQAFADFTALPGHEFHFDGGRRARRGAEEAPPHTVARSRCSTCREPGCHRLGDREVAYLVAGLREPRHVPRVGSRPDRDEHGLRAIGWFAERNLEP